MSDKPEDQLGEEQGLKKVSLADAIKQKLAQKKADQAAARANPKQAGNNNQSGKSQMTKKVNNQRRRTGGS
ncbi:MULTISPECIES: hypothetical protein [unclassified Paenibacillus]|jgi:hypothetical protein|uniref:hypothetical protein n=1 Tax=unclassified Paenibacillus TaxID=185978 RepID=UPI002781D017|nr:MULTISPECIES: hypothetical protein [unclassified Paenibacillus]MDF2646591.1 hypothetical protein [Paenibacillus sp.]MDQ0898607.1 hypothetical protein [Paenibacillus sp. V4I7]MDQ0915402.1 hypothetical protein [Paenibacillus sp. V4I5]